MLDSIKYAALSCRYPLEGYLQKINRYDKSLGVWAKEGVVKSTANKLRWTFAQRDETRRLQSYLSVHVGTINALLALHGLEMLDLALDRAEADQLRIQDKLEDSRVVVAQVRDDVKAQAQIIQTNNSMIASLSQMIGGELFATYRSLVNMVAKVWCVFMISTMRSSQ